jgi:hypothetical protein
MNNYLLAIDPSLRSTGAVLFYNQEIVASKHIKTPLKLTRFDAMRFQAIEMRIFLGESIGVQDPSIDCVVEKQVRRKDDRMGMDDFLRLSAMSYMIIPHEFVKYVTFVEPSTWKKSIPKKIHHKRIRDEELKLGSALVHFADMQPDIMDAIGIGRWYYANKV